MHDACSLLKYQPNVLAGSETTANLWHWQLLFWGLEPAFQVILVLYRTASGDAHSHRHATRGGGKQLGEAGRYRSLVNSSCLNRHMQTPSQEFQGIIFSLQELGCSRYLGTALSKSCTSTRVTKLGGLF